MLSAPPHGVKVVVTTRVAPRALLLHQPGRSAADRPGRGAALAVRREGAAGEGRGRRLGLQDRPGRVAGAGRGSGPGGIRGRWRRWRRSCPPTATPRLPELLAQTQRLPDNVVEALVGEAFQPARPAGPADHAGAGDLPGAGAGGRGRLPAAALPAGDRRRPGAGPAGEHAVRPPRRRPLLPAPGRPRLRPGPHPAGQPGDRDAEPAAVHPHRAADRGADYFTQTRTPRREWKTLDDLAPQLAEFELRCQGGDYDTAAQVLLAIDFDYLTSGATTARHRPAHPPAQATSPTRWTRWPATSNLGSCYLPLGQTAQRSSSTSRPWPSPGRPATATAKAAQLGNLGNCYADLGQTQRAIELYEQALAIARETGDRDGEGRSLGNLGNCYATLGQTERAIELYEQALAIDRETGNRGGEGTRPGQPRQPLRDLGQTERAIELYQQALAIARETGDRSGEGSAAWATSASATTTSGRPSRRSSSTSRRWPSPGRSATATAKAARLGNLGSGYDALGQTEQAIEHYQQALAIARETGNRDGEATIWATSAAATRPGPERSGRSSCYEQALAIDREIGDRGDEAHSLGGLGEVYADLGQTAAAIEHYQQALEIGGETGSARLQAEVHLGLARIHLDREEWPEALQAAESARSHGYQLILTRVLAALGTAYLGKGDHLKASEAFSAALSAANTLLAGTSGLIDVLYARGIACAGLAVTGEPGVAQVACDTFEQARAAAPAPGLRARALRQLQLLVPADTDGLLMESQRVLLD